MTDFFAFCLHSACIFGFFRPFTWCLVRFSSCQIRRTWQMVIGHICSIKRIKLNCFYTFYHNIPLTGQFKGKNVRMMTSPSMTMNVSHQHLLHLQPSPQQLPFGLLSNYEAPPPGEAPQPREAPPPLEEEEKGMPDVGQRLYWTILIPIVYLI